MTERRIWVVPRNDLEAVEIINLLKQHGEIIVESQQPWGASWENLEPDVVASVEALLAESPQAEAIGVELAGELRWNGRNIDHHSYGEEDRFVELSSLEQVAQVVGSELNRYQQLVSANDKGWIPGLIEAGASSGEIEAIRIADRCAQGITPDDEAAAVRAIQQAERRGRKVFVQTNLSSWKLSPISDRLYGESDERLIAASNAWLYDGPRHRQLFDLVHNRGFGHERDWVGGRSESGYAGFIEPTEETRRLITEFFWKDKEENDG